MSPPANDRSFATWRPSMAASCGRFSRSANWSKARSTKSRRVAATRVAATRLDLVDRAFDQFADLENLPQLAAILGRQVAKDLSLAGGDIGNRHGCTHGYGQSQHRVKLTLSRCISTVHEFFLNVQQKMRRREFLVRIVPCSVCDASQNKV